MGYAVFHLEKSPGNESAMTEHIERVKVHPNVDPSRIELNKELIGFPDGVKDRTETIQHRLDTAGLERQIGKNQVKVIRVLLSGTPEDMQRIQDEGRLDDWCRDNMDYLKKTFGEENVVAATLHMDESTPHIHASVVPIVRGERRQKKKRQEDNQAQKPKRTYKKKAPNRTRLCADDVMAREKLIEYQDTYGEAMAKYGLIRGEKNSDARHITLTEYYRNQKVESRNLQTNIDLLLAEEDAKRKHIEELRRKEQEARQKSAQAEELQQQKESELKKTEENLNQVKGQLKTEEFKNKAADVGSNIMDGIGSMIGTSKVKRQQQEIENLKGEKKELQQKITGLNQAVNQERTEKDKLTGEINKIHYWLPDTPNLIKWGEYCQKIGFTSDQAKDLINMKPVLFSGELYSSEYSQRFKVNDAEVRFDRSTEKHSSFRLLINGISLTRWFRQKYDEFREALGLKPKQRLGMGKNKGIKNN